MPSCLDAALNTVSGLQPALALMKYIWDEVEKVEINRTQCQYLVRRADRILITINDCLHGAEHEPIDIDVHLQRLQRNLEFVADLVRNMACLPLLKSLLARDNIRMRIEDAHLRLTDSLVGFQISATVELCRHQDEDERARKADTDQMQQRLRKLENNDTELIRTFRVEHNQMLEAMLAMQNNIIRNIENCVERRLLQVALASFQRLTQQRTPERIPSWLITSFDIEVDKNTILGSGSFGTVKKALWKGIAVAVKLMGPETDQNVLLHEIKIWKKLRHDHIVPFYGASIVADPPFIVCRFMRNGSLVKYLRMNPHANRAKLAHEMALGMLYLHDNHIVHGDLKTANVLVDDYDQACITDFGLSKIQYDARSRASSVTATTTSPIGTLRFMSPQQLRGEMSKASDVYSYSMTLYEAFVGEVPFSTVPDHALFEVICREGQRLKRPSSVKALSHGLTDGIWDVIWQCSDPVDKLRPTFHMIARKTEDLRKSWQPDTITTSTYSKEDLFMGLDLGFDDSTKTEPTSEVARREAVKKWCATMNVYLCKHAEEHNQTVEEVLHRWRKYYESFFMALKPHFVKLNGYTKQLSGHRLIVLDYQCNTLWAECVVQECPEAFPYALDYGFPISSWLNKFGGMATRITSLDGVLGEPVDIALWWTPAPMTLEHYVLHSTILRKGGILLGAVNLGGWTEDEYSRDIHQPPGFQLLTNYVEHVAYPSAQDTTPHRLFALQTTSAS